MDAYPLCLALKCFCKFFDTIFHQGVGLSLSWIQARLGRRRWRNRRNANKIKGMHLLCILGDTCLLISEMPDEMPDYPELARSWSEVPDISYTYASLDVWTMPSKAFEDAFEDVWRCRQRHSVPRHLVTYHHQLPKQVPSHHVAEKSHPSWPVRIPDLKHTGITSFGETHSALA